MFKHKNSSAAVNLISKLYKAVANPSQSLRHPLPHLKIDPKIKIRGK